MTNLDKIKAENAQRRILRDRIREEWEDGGIGAVYQAARSFCNDAPEDTIDALVAEVERLKAGLEQYASITNWYPSEEDGGDFRNWYRFQPGTQPISEHGYDLARSILKRED